MTQSPNSNALTEGIRVTAAAQFIPDQSDPDRGVYFYAYRVRIKNEGEQRAKLLSRHWIILDAHGQRRDVVDDGVVGEQPDLAPGDSFEYTSSCPMRTEWGTMEGTYTFEREDGTQFEAAIGRFFLVPSAQNVDVLDQ